MADASGPAAASDPAVTRPDQDLTPTPRAPRASAPATAAISRLPVWGAELHVVPIKGGVTSLDSEGRSYRGELVTAPGELVDDVTVEDYLLGLGEVRDPNWPAAGLQAQVMAARTYALRAAFAADDAATPAHVNFCDTDVCQVYLGAGAEYPALTAAVHATDHLAVVFQNQLAATYYSASAGGETASPAEGFGSASSAVPYLVPVAYDTGGGDGWQRSLDPASVAHDLGYDGSLTSMDVTARGPSGRATEVVLHGSAGDLTTTGLAVESALKLPSTLFETGSGVPAPMIDAVPSAGSDPSSTQSTAVGFPANEPVALVVATSVPLPQVAPELPVAAFSVGGVSAAAGVASAGGAVTGSVWPEPGRLIGDGDLNASSPLLQLDVAASRRPGLAGGVVRRSSTYLWLDALLFLGASVGAGVLWPRHRRHS